MVISPSKALPTALKVYIHPQQSIRVPAVQDYSALETLSHFIYL